MKVKESYWHEAAKADKNDKSNWSSDAPRRNQISAEQHSNAANKSRQADAPLKDETKFADFLDSSAAKMQKPNGREEDSSERRRDDQKKDKKHVGAEKDARESNAASDGKAEKYESSGGQTGNGGGQNGFGAGANVGQLNLSENFAARSILHIADLERLVSTVRTQINSGGRREIVLQLKQSVLEGLQVKITTDAAARVAVEFLAANESTRSQIAAHTQELAGILRGRGINLSSLTASLDTNEGNQNFSNGESVKLNRSSGGDDLSEENTFDAPPPVDDKIYQA